eukprot:m51a1_g10093 hypothetical protein (2047) ;mRNA; f:32585-39312
MSLSVTLGNFTLADTARPLGPDVQCLVQVSFGAMQATTPLCTPNENGVYAFPGFAIFLDTTTTTSIGVEVHVASGALVDSGELPVGRLSGTTATLRLRCAELSVSVERASGGSRDIEGQPGTSRALVVGINKYPEGFELEGCINDTLTVRTWLEHIGIDMKDVKVLLDEDATEAAVLRELQALVADAGAGDLRVFTYSGHGTVSRINGVKIAAICPIDFFDNRTNPQLTSDRLGSVLMPAAQRGATVVMHMDCCHSGTMGTTWKPDPNGDDVNYRKPRFIPEDLTGVTEDSRDLSSVLDFHKTFAAINNSLCAQDQKRQARAAKSPLGAQDGTVTTTSGAKVHLRPGRLMLFGSVMDSLRCGVDLGAAARAGMTVGPNEEGRFLNIVDGTSGIAPEVVEAATNITVEGSRDIDSELSDEGAKALSAMSARGWADAVVKALRADPNRLTDIINGVTGADATPQHRNLVAKDIADTALVRHIVTRIAACNRSRGAARAPMDAQLLSIARLKPDQQEAALRRAPLSKCLHCLDTFSLQDIQEEDEKKRGQTDKDARAPQQKANLLYDKPEFIRAAEVTKRGWSDVFHSVLNVAGNVAVEIAKQHASRGLKGEELKTALGTAQDYATVDALARVIDCHQKAPEPKPQWRMKLIKDVSRALNYNKLEPAQLQALLDHPREVLVKSVKSEEQMKDVRAAFIESAHNGDPSVVAGDISQGAAVAPGSAGLLRAVREVSFRGFGDLLGKVLGKAPLVVQTLIDGAFRSLEDEKEAEKSRDLSPPSHEKMDSETLLRHVCNMGLADSIAEEPQKREAFAQLALDRDIVDTRLSSDKGFIQREAICEALDKMDDETVRSFLQDHCGTDITNQAGAEAARGLMAKGWKKLFEQRLPARIPGIVAPVVSLRCPDWKGTSTREQAEAISEALYRVSNRTWRDIVKDADIDVDMPQRGGAAFYTFAASKAAKGASDAQGSSEGGEGEAPKEPQLPITERGWSSIWKGFKKVAGKVAQGVASMAQEVTKVTLPVLEKIAPLIAEHVMRDINVADGVDIDELTREMAICPYRDFISALAKQHPAAVLPILTKARGRGTDIGVQEATDAVLRATEQEVMAIATRALKTASASIMPYLSEACKTQLSAAGAKVFSEKKARGIEAATFSGGAPRATGTTGGLVLMAACQITQTAADAHIDGKRQGAFTCYVNKALLEHGFRENKEISYDLVMADVRKRLSESNYEQRPNFVPLDLGPNKYFRPIQVTPAAAGQAVVPVSPSPAPPAPDGGSTKPDVKPHPAPVDPVSPAVEIEAEEEEPTEGPIVLLQWDSAVSIRKVPVSRLVGHGHLEDEQIVVVETLKCTGGVEELLRVTDLEDIDAIHTYTTVRNAIDAYERCLAQALEKSKEDATVAMEELCGKGSCKFKCCTSSTNCPLRQADEKKSPLPFRWPSAKERTEKLQISTRTADFGQPYYTAPVRWDATPALRFPVFDMASGDGSDRKTKVSTCRSVETVAHTVGYALLDAMQPEWRKVATYPWAAVIHEAFADLTALLVPLANPSVCAAVVVQSRGDVSAGNLLGLSNLTLAETLGMSALRSAGSTLTLSKAFSAGPQDSRTVSSVLTSAYYGALASTFNDLHTSRAMELGETLHVVAKHAITVLLGAVMRCPPCVTLRGLAATLANEANPYPLSEEAKKDWFMSGLHQHFYEALLSLMRLKELIPPDAPKRQQFASGRGGTTGTSGGTSQQPPKRLYDIKLCPEQLSHTSPTIRNFYMADIQDSRADRNRRSEDQSRDQGQDQGESQDKDQCEWQGQGYRPYERQDKGQPQPQRQGDRGFPYDGQGKGRRQRQGQGVCECDDQGQGQGQCQGKEQGGKSVEPLPEISVVTPKMNAEFPKVTFDDFGSTEWVFTPALVYRCVADMVHTGLPGLECPISYEIWLAWSRRAGKALVELKKPPKQPPQIGRGTSEQQQVCVCPQPQQEQQGMNGAVWKMFMNDTRDLYRSYIMQRWMEDIAAWEHLNEACDGQDPIASFTAFARAVAGICMRGRSPAILLWRRLLDSMESVKSD